MFSKHAKDRIHDFIFEMAIFTDLVFKNKLFYISLQSSVNCDLAFT